MRQSQTSLYLAESVRMNWFLWLWRRHAPSLRDRDKLQKVAAAGMLQPKLPPPGIWPKSTSQGMRPKLSSDLWPKSLSAVWNICLFPNFSDLNDLCSIYVTPDHAGVSHTFKFCSALVPLWKDNEDSFKTIPLWLSRTCSTWCFFLTMQLVHTRIRQIRKTWNKHATHASLYRMHLMQIYLLGEIRKADMLNVNWRRSEGVHKLAELLLKSGKLKKLNPAKKRQRRATSHTNQCINQKMILFGCC